MDKRVFSPSVNHADTSGYVNDEVYRRLSASPLGCYVTRGNMKTLTDPKEWISDEIITFYFKLLELYVNKTNASKQSKEVFVSSSQFMNKLLQDKDDMRFYRYSGMESWIPKDINSFKRILIPINSQKSHWTLAVINIKDSTIEYFDSLHSSEKYKHLNI